MSLGPVERARNLNAFFQSVPDYSLVQFSPGACYRLDGTLHLDDRNGLVIDGRGAKRVRAGALFPAQQ